MTGCTAVLAMTSCTAVLITIPCVAGLVMTRCMGGPGGISYRVARAMTCCTAGCRVLPVMLAAMPATLYGNVQSNHKLVVSG